MINEVGDAYSRRAAEYIDLLGSMEATHPSDRQLVSTWADSVEGPVLDAGCGPGQWTGFLAQRGRTAQGVDLVPAFIDHARRTHAGIPFAVGSLHALDIETGSLGGILAWYSLIHHEPHTIGVPLREFHRALRPGGGLLIGFLEGRVAEPYDHAVTTAYLWPVDGLADALRTAGFEGIESHVRKTGGQRPQAAIVARRDRAR